VAVSDEAKFGVVAIGRNEGERLKQCLNSLSEALLIVYVDSGSSDGSAQWARDHGVNVVDLDMNSPFTAARARNVGFQRMRELAPHVAYVQFVDGDCELSLEWPKRAVAYLTACLDIGAVCGRLRERFPERSIYNWLCDREWDRPVGEARSFGGNVMIRVSALEAVGGYRDDVIAAEDDELSVRLRVAGWRLWRLDSEMAIHDAAMLHFGQWWRRAMRCGYGFALGSYLHGALPQRHFVWESRRTWLWGFWLPLGCLAASIAFWPQGSMAWLVYPLQVIRQIARNKGSFRDRAPLALFQVLGRFPESLGQMKFTLDRLSGRERRLIEYE
jgi:glycosyltransferase involved in cell wall biosynthesis